MDRYVEREGGRETDKRAEGEVWRMQRDGQA